jgi:hypothetical protein
MVGYLPEIETGCNGRRICRNVGGVFRDQKAEGNALRKIVQAEAHRRSA